jgi:triacylglycerol lipase
VSGEDPPCPSHTNSLGAWSRSAINALVGDYLNDDRNSLALRMSFYARNRPLNLSRDGILRTHPQPTRKLAVFVHGLACHEGIWAFHDPMQGPNATSYGARLRVDLGYTPFFVRYNTGLSIEENGARLSALLESLLACYPSPVDRLLLVGHSMGGLVIGEAARAGGRTRAAWLGRADQVIYLGTPHEGAPLARLGDTATTVLKIVPNPITQLIGSIFDRRSKGLKDLRDGATGPRQHLGEESTGGTPTWSPRTHHYMVVGMLAGDPDHPVSVLLGDGLVQIPGRRNRDRGEVGGAEHDDRIRLFPSTHHLQLTRDPAVYEQIRRWCENP